MLTNNFVTEVSKLGLDSSVYSAISAVTNKLTIAAVDNKVDASKFVNTDTVVAVAKALKENPKTNIAGFFTKLVNDSDIAAETKKAIVTAILSTK